MTGADRGSVLRFFVLDLSRYSSYEELRLVVERSDPLPLRVPALPYSPSALSVFATLLLDADELGCEHRLSLEWMSPDGDLAACQEETLDVPGDAVVSGSFPVSFVVNFAGLRLLSPGTYRARLMLDGKELESLPVEVGVETAPV